MWWQYVIAVAGVAVGFARGWQAVRRSRTRTESAGSILVWNERSVSLWRLDWSVALFVTLHSASVLTLGVLFLLYAAHSDGQYKLFLLDATPYMPEGARQAFNRDLALVVAAGLGVVGFICGSLLAYPVATRRINPIPMSINTGGTVHGLHASPWNAYSHHAADPHRRIIRFYSERIPEIACMAWKPPDQDTFKQALTLVEKHLPRSRSKTPVPWHRRRIAFIVLLLASTIPFVAGGLWVYQFPWAWMYYTFVPFLVFFLGPVILKFYHLG